MDLESHTHKVYGCWGQRYNYEGFSEKFKYQMSLNRGRTTTTQGAYTSLERIISFPLFIYW